MIFEHCQNALYPIFSKPSLNEISFKTLHVSKVDSLISFTFEGILIFLNLFANSKVLFSITSIDSGKVTPVTLLVLKAPSLITFVPSKIEYSTLLPIGKPTIVDKSFE